MRMLALLALIVACVPLAAQGSAKDGRYAPDGTAVQLDLPDALHLRNSGGNDRTRYNPAGEPGKGSGLCVFTSLNHSAYWHNIAALQDFRDWMKNHPGGGWPEKVDAMIAQRCKERGEAKPEYFHVLSNDLEILKLACATGRMPAITYSFSPTGRYKGNRISHMVTLVAAGVGKGPDGKGWWAVLDNNYPAELEWLSERQFLATYSGGARGWAVVFRKPGPPPVPKG